MARSIIDIFKLPKSIREAEYKSVDIQRILIDGNEIDGYMTYSYFDAKSYVKSPVRSNNGAINNLNSYSTFLTPRLTIKFNLMSIDTYRVIMKLIEQKNEFVVTCYNIVWNKQVTHKMYFEPEDFPELYIYDLETLGVMDYSIVLTGTNADLDTVNITYHLNPPADTGRSDETFGTTDNPKGVEVLIGEGSVFQQETFNDSYVFDRWTENNDGTGFAYVDNTAYLLTQPLVLYAKWRQNKIYTLSYNYGVGETKVDEHGVPIYSKSIEYQTAIGTLPDTSAKGVLHNGKTYYPYTVDGWYLTPVKGIGSQKLTSASLYQVQGNSTIYQIFGINKYTITYNSNGGDYTPAQATQEYGSIVYEPPSPKKDGYTFDGWWTTSNFEDGTKFVFNTMSPFNLTLYAKWV